MRRVTTYSAVGLVTLLGCGGKLESSGDSTGSGGSIQSSGGSTGVGGAVQSSGGIQASSGGITGRASGGASTGGFRPFAGGSTPIPATGGRQSAAGGSAPGSCGDIEATIWPLPAVLEFVIDNTGSFQDDAYPNDDAKNRTKWEEMLRVFPEVIRALPATWAVGTTYYNLSGATSDPAACYLGSQASPIEPLTAEHVDHVINTMPTNGVGATPTYAAWQFGLRQLVDWGPPAGYEESPRRVVLITDGIPTVKNNGCYAPITCGAEPPMWEPSTPPCVEGELVRSDGRHAISEAEYDRALTGVREMTAGAGYQTYVVGVLGTEDGQGALYDPFYKLSQFAEAGGTVTPGCVSAPGTMWIDPDSTLYSRVETRGTYCHIDATTNEDFAQGLQDGLRKIVASLVSCTYEVPASGSNEPVDLDNMLVTYYRSGDSTDPGAAVRLRQNKNGETDPSCPQRTIPDGTVVPAGSGWYYSKFDERTGEPSQLSLCPDSCDLVRSDLDARLKITFQCILTY